MCEYDKYGAANQTGVNMKTLTLQQIHSVSGGDFSERVNSIFSYEN